MENNVESDKKPATSVNALEPVLNKIAQYRTPIPVAFILVVIFFFFGFSSFKCNGNKVASLKGINLVTGTHLKTQASGMLNGNPFSAINGNNENSGNREQKVPPNFWAILAFASAIAGFVVFYRKEQKEALWGMQLGALGFISLFILRLVIKSKVENQGGGMVNIETNFLFGYWASLLAFIVAGGISYLRLLRKPEAVNPVQDNKMSKTQGPTPIHVNIITQDNDTSS
jgi:hypothetical protein